ncbi:hypothetical protein [Glycomyces terrestris]|uniref:Uncharacterized protein n=1 Tax=Glycomyces terrestris TaxID=2493553 RepID=A0A426URD4_9ACTN|nr:hypothetical protein [Glycomyces terrestris]RRR95556.1 hypothetical protein EIW28_23900 [Glycomyces terrestris]
MKKKPGDRYQIGHNPLEGYTLDELVTVALGRAKDHAELGEETESTAWAAIAQAAATFHLSQTLANLRE